jgi:hypothetical protein
MAISGGWDASGAGFVKLLVGTIIYPTCLCITDGDTNLTWRISLNCSSISGTVLCQLFDKYSDNCPLGNYNQVKRVGLMVEQISVTRFQVAP